MESNLQPLHEDPERNPLRVLGIGPAILRLKLSMAEKHRLVLTVARALSLSLHPDAGGSAKLGSAQEVNNARNEIKRFLDFVQAYEAFEQEERDLPAQVAALKRDVQRLSADARDASISSEERGSQLAAERKRVRANTDMRVRIDAARSLRFGAESSSVISLFDSVKLELLVPTLRESASAKNSTVTRFSRLFGVEDRLLRTDLDERAASLWALRSHPLKTDVRYTSVTVSGGVAKLKENVCIVGSTPINSISKIQLPRKFNKLGPWFVEVPETFSDAIYPVIVKNWALIARRRRQGRSTTVDIPDSQHIADILTQPTDPLFVLGMPFVFSR